MFSQLQRHAPYFPGIQIIFADCPIGKTSTNARRIAVCHARPLLRIAVGTTHCLLAAILAFVVGQQQVFVLPQQMIDSRANQSAVAA